MKKHANWFLNIEAADGAAVSIVKALQISKIAAGSPAAALNLEPGDYFLSINKQPALTANVVDILIKGGNVTYQFFLPKKNKTLTVQTPALPLGLRTETTSDGIVVQYKKGRTSWDALGIMQLWEREDYEHLRQVAAHRGRGLLGKLLGKANANPISNLLTAIVDIETGDKAKGFVALQSFQANYMSGYTSDIHALVGYYEAKRLMMLDGVDVQQIKNKIWDMMDSHQDSDRMTRLAEESDVDYPRKGQRLDKSYVFDLRMNCLEGAVRETSVPEAISALTPKQIQPICFMITYRGNGPYDDDLKVYRSVYPHLKDQIAPLFVITSESEKRKDRPHWFEAEEALIKAGVPITVAHDPSAAFADIHLSAAPEFIAVNKEGMVIWDQNLGDDYDYWDMVSRA